LGRIQLNTALPALRTFSFFLGHGVSPISS
jgi:hypothetical protein